MDPALWEILRTGAARDAAEVEAIVRLDEAHRGVPGVRLVARFGPIATCRFRADGIVTARADENVISLKASRPLGPERESLARSLPRRANLPVHDPRRPPGLTLTGAKVCVGVVDWGCDFDHPNFKSARGSTRLLALWDQRGSRRPDSPAPYGYGTVYGAAEIDAALATADPYDALGYHPADADRDGSGAHGTFVMDVAAGNGLAGGPSGVAPSADLIFVHLADRGTGGLANLGDSVRILEAVDFVSKVAGRRPWVINLSLGRHGGPHDGTTLAELALDYLVREAPGRFIVQSTGNYFDKGCHTSGRLSSGETHTLRLVTSEADVTPNELELWYPGEDEFVISLESPAGSRHPALELGEQADVLEGGRVVGRLYHRERDPNNLDNHVELFLYPWAPAGAWDVTIEALRASNGRFHAWLERDEACSDCQARFAAPNADSQTTTGTIANGHATLVVGAYDASSRSRELAPFSSSGPTRDGRRKPDLVAPGVQVLAARSAPRDDRRSEGLLARKSGTSFAAPHVTGAVALLLEGAPRLTSAQIRALLLKTTEPSRMNDRTSPRLGHGYLDIARAVETLAASRFGAGSQTSTATRPPQRRDDTKEFEMTPILEHTLRSSLDPDRVYRELVYRRSGPLCAWIDQRFLVLARPGDPPRATPQAGDVLVRVALGEPNGGSVGVLSSPRLVSLRALAAMGSPGERAGRGLYGTVVEQGPFPDSDHGGAARRILDASGHMPLGQLLLRSRSGLDVDESVSLISDLAREEAGEDEPRLRTLIDSGASENDLTNTLFFERNPTIPKGPLRPGSAQAREWQTIRDREVRPALKARVMRGRVDPVLLATFFSQYETDDRVSSRAKERFLTQSPLLSMGKTLRDRLLSRWRSGRPPATLADCYALAFDICGHAGTAALLCHNVTKAFARGGQAIHWQATGTQGEYTDGTRTYTAKVVHRGGRLTWISPKKGEVRSIYYVVFSAKEFGRSDPGDWYHYFVTATMTAFGAAGELSGGDPSGRGRGEAAEDGRGGPIVQITRIAYPALVADRVLDVEGQMTDSSLHRFPGYRGWVLANVLSFLEGGYYGGDQVEVSRESRGHLRGAVFGLRQARVKPGTNWRWYVPRGGSISQDELLTGFSLTSKTAEVLLPTGRPASRIKSAAGESQESNGRPTFCERARAEARSHDRASAQLIELLKLPIGASEQGRLARRVRALMTLFASLNRDQKVALGRRLTDPADALARLFDCELDRRFRARLRTMLEVPPQPPPAPAPTPTQSDRCRREMGSITALLPWERQFLAIAHGRDEQEFRGIALLVGPIILPGLMTQFHRMIVSTALQHGYAITIENNVWFPRAIDTRTTNDLAWLAHESVHVLDYATAGTQAFLQTYAMQALKAGFSHDDIPHEQRANRLEAAVEGLLGRFPDLANLIASCDGAAISADLAQRREAYRGAINELLAAAP
jgi:subtilisin family serine protease